MRYLVIFSESSGGASCRLVQSDFIVFKYWLESVGYPDIQVFGQLQCS